MDWNEVKDPSSGKSYYHNAKTGATSVSFARFRAPSPPPECMGSCDAGPSSRSVLTLRVPRSPFPRPRSGRSQRASVLTPTEVGSQ